jgi:serine protease Do
MKSRGLKTVLFCTICFAFLLSACGGGGAVASLEDAKSAIIQIEAKGSFVDPEVGLMLNVAGRGSGFIIDPSGIAVTNNHVVTGSATLEVWVGGETESYNARILGVSECSDLAVIDIDGEDFPYLAWYDDSISAGMDVYAAGFPLGDPEYTLTRGIVSKENASGESAYSSVDDVIEHDATINPGNSGGPLITPDGEVVGINYLGRSRPGTQTQFFAIDREEALAMIETMQSGDDVDSIGINGQAVNNGEGLSGIWVSSVKSGSPADVAGIKGGDIIITIEGLVLATDYTLSDYCDILRTHDPGDTLNVQVLRFSTGEFLEGQINGRPLEASISAAVAPPSGESSSSSSGTSGGPDYGSYIAIADDSRALTVEVPSDWIEVVGPSWEYTGSVIGATIIASGDLDKFYEGYSEPGVIIQVTNEVDLFGSITNYLDAVQGVWLGYCDSVGDRYPHETELWTAETDFFEGCGVAGENATLLQTVMVPKAYPDMYLASVVVLVHTDADISAWGRIVGTLNVVAELP